MANSGDYLFWVYGICIGKRVLYVGYTDNPVRRFEEHFERACNISSNNRHPVYANLHSAMRKGIIPRFKILGVKYNKNLEGHYSDRHSSTMIQYTFKSDKPITNYSGSILSEMRAERLKLKESAIKQMSFFKQYLCS